MGSKDWTDNILVCDSIHTLIYRSNFSILWCERGMDYWSRIFFFSIGILYSIQQCWL